jgi:predicted RNA-binding Zn ribbon-like protein
MRIPTAVRDIVLDGGHPALDFVNTVHSWVAPRAKDHWSSPIELIGWHQRLRLVDPVTADAFVALAPRRAERLLRRARAARERLHELFAGVAETRSASPTELQWLDAELARLASFRHLDSRGGNVMWAVRPDPSEPASLLAPALFAAADLLTTANLERIKACPPPEGCGWLFYDRSRNAGRVWCSMKTCGNTAKVRRFRERLRS